MTEIKYPTNYKPLKTLEVCSNKINGGGSIIGFNNFAPILIGKGVVPTIWLYAKDNSADWVPVVEENESKHVKVQIEKSIPLRELTAKVDDTLIIRAQMTDEDVCAVTILDLRPIGLNIYGDTTSLKIGDSTFNGNVFEVSTFMIAINEKPD